MDPNLDALVDFVAEAHFNPYNFSPEMFINRYDSDNESYRTQLIMLATFGFKYIERRKEYAARRDLKHQKYDPEGFEKLKGAIAEELIRMEQQRLVKAKKKADFIEGQLDRIEERQNTILQKWFVSGKPLGTVTRLDLKFASRHAQKSADGHIKLVSFYDALCDRLPYDKSIVQDHITASQVELIRATIFTSDDSSSN